MSDFVFKCENLRVRYPNGTEAARGMNLAIAAGECAALIGESSSGKTTLARAALGILPVGSLVWGSIRITDTEIVGANEKILRRVRGLVAGFVAQNPFAACNPLATVGDHVAEAWRVHGLEPPENAVVAALENLGIEDAEFWARKFPHEWSGGMLQRAELAAATAHRPPLVIADEPTSAVDADRAESILNLLRRTNAAVLLISHDLRLAARHADRVFICHEGRIVEAGATRQILENPSHEATRKLLAAASGETFFAPALPATAETILTARGVSQTYAPNVRAVVRADLQIRRGEIVGICGASGSGKSTLLRLLATVETPASGEIFLGGELATSGASRKLLSKRARNGFIAPVFQDSFASLDSNWAIWRSVTEPLTAKRLVKRFSRSERRAIAREKLSEVGLPAIDLEARPAQISAGQAARVCLARAFCAAPALVVADEPTAALDTSTAQTILRLLAEIARRGTAIVIVSHDEFMLKSLCHRILRMRDGVLEF